VLVLQPGDALALGAGDGLVGVVLGVVGDHVGARLAARHHPGLDVEVVEDRAPRIGHAAGELLELLRAGVPENRPGLGERCATGTDDFGHDTSTPRRVCRSADSSLLAFALARRPGPPLVAARLPRSTVYERV